MSCSIVKCNGCKIVINELLAFVQNKCDVMDAEGIVRLCLSSFTVAEVDMAKKLLFESIKPNIRLCKKGSKAERNLHDIVAVLKVSEPDAIPIFVARDLQKLPPLTFDHIDVTRVLKDLLFVQNEIKKINSTYVTKEEFYKTKNLHTNIPHSDNVLSNYQDCNSDSRNINFKRGGYVLHEDAEDSPLAHRSRAVESSNRSRRPSHSSTSGSCNEAISLAQESTTLPLGEVHVEAPTAVSPRKMRPTAIVRDEWRGGNSVTCGTGRSFANVARTDIEKSNLEWKTVNKRKKYKYKYIGQRGKAVIDQEVKFKAAEINVPLFINRVDKNTSQMDVREYIVSRTGVEVQLEKIISKHHKDYDAYKIFVPRHKLDIFLDGSLWPEGIIYRRFIEYRSRPYKGMNEKNNNTNG